MTAYTPFQLVSAGQSHPGQRRQLNEDAWRIAGQNDAPHLWPERGRLFAVADGMGGHAAGEVASQLAIDTLFQEYYRDDGPVIPMTARLEQAITVANRAVYRQSVSDKAQSGMGTTLVVAVVREDWLTVASVGDSRVYLLRGGETKQITHDHSWVAEQVEAGVLTEDEARAHIYRSVVTRSIGHHQDVQIDTFEFLLDSGDIVLLCSDGLSGQVSDAEIALTLGQNPLNEAVERLIELANLAGGPDNITVVVLQVSESATGEAAPLTTASQGQRPALIEPRPKLISSSATSKSIAPSRARIPTYLVGGLLLGAIVLIALVSGGIWAIRSGWMQFLFAKPTPIQAATATPLLASSPTNVPATSTVTAVPPPTGTSTAAAAPTSTATAVPTPTRTLTPTPTPSPTPSPTATATLTPTPLPTSGPQIPQ
ncbi:MAG: Stp1/IreP family PP2C-type Ser/Thr phosphatase [Anaerolineae bacterium]|nr:Stp1/IreP family PP2C-type Ser/Thr phosphatase [Anaerolineae bacterium]